jgi:Ion channel
MGIALAALGLVIILAVLVDGFEAMILPRRVSHPFRFARLFYRVTWTVWRQIAVRIPQGRRRETFLSWFGPLSMLMLFGSWAAGLVFGFGVLNLALEVPLRIAADESVGLGTYLYMSGTTFFTLGYGDITPLSAVGRCLTVLEAGMGFAFLASIIGYLPVLYQSFARREVTISLLDARAGSPPSAFHFLQRAAQAHSIEMVRSFLAEWERWSAEVLESQLSYPALCYYRSQHDNQSWLAALTAMLDTCSILLVSVKEVDTHQARLTFAMARHVAVDISMTLGVLPEAPVPDRLSPENWRRFYQELSATGPVLAQGSGVYEKLAELRGMYEPFVNALADRLLFALPEFKPSRQAVDNWQTSAWMRRTPGLGGLPTAVVEDQHFD